MRVRGCGGVEGERGGEDAPESDEREFCVRVATALRSVIELTPNQCE